MPAQSLIRVNKGITRSTILHLRIPFSFFLLPVYLFALSEVETFNLTNFIISFAILHLLVFPSSNGYNSYNDRDTDSIGLLKKPPAITYDLLIVTAVMDILAVFAGLLISTEFSILLTGFILMSRAYSNRSIRLKKYPFYSFLIVAFFQGAYVFLLSYTALSGTPVTNVLRADGIGREMLISSLYIGSSYPLTQIYQHRSDRIDGVITLSYLLGHIGTFIFSITLFVIATILLYIHFNDKQNLAAFYIFNMVMLPDISFFFYWMFKVKRDRLQANYKNTMLMNLITSLCMNAFFLIQILD